MERVMSWVAGRPGGRGEDVVDGKAICLGIAIAMGDLSVGNGVRRGTIYV